MLKTRDDKAEMPTLESFRETDATNAIKAWTNSSCLTHY
jgi:hypothetical protein